MPWLQSHGIHSSQKTWSGIDWSYIIMWALWNKWQSSTDLMIYMLLCIQSSVVQLCIIRWDRTSRRHFSWRNIWGHLQSIIKFFSICIHQTHCCAFERCAKRFYSRPVFGLRVLSLPAYVRLSVHLCVNHLLVRDNSKSVQARITKFGPKV